MSGGHGRAIGLAVVIALLVGARGQAAETVEPAAAFDDSLAVLDEPLDEPLGEPLDEPLDAYVPAQPTAPPAAPRVLEPLVPEVAGNPYRLEPGDRAYLSRLSVSPAFGWLGTGRLFALRIAYNPYSWLGYEGSLGHNPGQSVHAVLHSVSAVVRKPLPGRFQPFAKAGYGMLMVSPGPSLNADPVTKNALTIGGGLEVYLRSDVAIRAESQLATVLGSNRDGEGTVAYHYAMSTIGLAFYRSISP